MAPAVCGETRAAITIPRRTSSANTPASLIRIEMTSCLVSTCASSLSCAGSRGSSAADSAPGWSGGRRGPAPAAGRGAARPRARAGRRAGRLRRSRRPCAAAAPPRGTSAPGPAGRRRSPGPATAESGPIAAAATPSRGAGRLPRSPARHQPGDEAGGHEHRHDDRAEVGVGELVPPGQDRHQQDPDPDREAPPAHHRRERMQPLPAVAWCGGPGVSGRPPAPRHPSRSRRRAASVPLQAGDPCVGRRRRRVQPHARDPNERSSGPAVTSMNCIRP